MALQRLLLVFVLMVLAVLIYQYFTQEGFAVGRKGSAPLIAAHPRTEPMPIAAAGPAPPTQQGTDANRAPPAAVEARDPYAETVDSAHAPERITHPEHYYGPGIAPELTSIGVEAGIASMRAEPGPHNATLFTPDQVANGGVYYDEVVPLEPTSGISYSVL